MQIKNEKKRNVVATDTLIKEKWSNRLVVMNVTHKLDSRFHFQICMRLSMLGMLLALNLISQRTLSYLKMNILKYVILC